MAVRGIRIIVGSKELTMVDAAGAHAARTLSQKLPRSWRVVCIDRNTHFNHVYALPRFAVVPGHEHKAFIP